MIKHARKKTIGAWSSIFYLPSCAQRNQKKTTSNDKTAHSARVIFFHSICIEFLVMLGKSNKISVLWKGITVFFLENITTVYLQFSWVCRCHICCFAFCSAVARVHFHFHSLGSRSLCVFFACVQESTSSFRRCKLSSLWPFIRTRHENGSYSAIICECCAFNQS